MSAGVGEGNKEEVADEGDAAGDDAFDDENPLTKEVRLLDCVESMGLLDLPAPSSQVSETIHLHEAICKNTLERLAQPYA